MAINSASGAKLYLGTSELAANLGEYQVDSYIEVGEIEDIGEFGDESSVITFASLSDGRVRKLKGPRDAGTIAVVCGADEADLGQAAMVAAEGQTLDYNFKIVLSDKLTLGGQNSNHFFQGKVMSKRLGVGNVSNVIRRTFNVGINSPITSTAPT